MPREAALVAPGMAYQFYEDTVAYLIFFDDLKNDEGHVDHENMSEGVGSSSFGPAAIGVGGARSQGVASAMNMNKT